MKKLSFATAVLATVSDFAARKVDFSAFDVTRSLRRAVESGDLELDQEVIHQPRDGKDGVQNVVQEIFEANELPSYKSENTGHYVLYSYDRTQNPFERIGDQIKAGMSLALSQGVPVLAGVQNAIQANQQPDIFSRVTALDEINLAIVNYVGRNLSVGYTPTLKEVQSALRRKGKLTCDEINKRLAAIGDYQVNLNGPLSKATVSKK